MPSLAAVKKRAMTVQGRWFLQSRNQAIAESQTLLVTFTSALTIRAIRAHAR